MTRFLELISGPPAAAKQVPLKDQLEFLMVIRESIKLTHTLASKVKNQPAIDMCNRDLVTCDSIINVMKSKETVS